MEVQEQKLRTQGEIFRAIYPFISCIQSGIVQTSFSEPRMTYPD
jgi:hypothetical protein